MKKLLLWLTVLSTMLIWWCSITLDEAAASSVQCDTLEDNFKILWNQLWILQSENEEQKNKIKDLENICKDNDILSWEIKKLNKKISELEEENAKIKEENKKLNDENKKLLAENGEIESEFSWTKSKIEKYIWIIKELRVELWSLKEELNNSKSTWEHASAPKDPNYISKNKIETNNIYTSGCEYTTKAHSEDNTYEDMPNKNWTEDVKFVNKKLEDVRENWENLVSKYIDEANEVLDSKWLTKRDQCKYSLLIDTLKNQKWIVNSYKNENWKITIWIDFITYKEEISRYDRRPSSRWNSRDIEKSPSSKTRYYTLSENPELETLNVDSNWFLHFSWNNNTIFINDRDSWLNRFCDNEPIYTELLVWDLAIYDTLGQYHNRNDWHYCIKKRLDTKWAWFEFRFDEKWNIKRIMAKYNLTR